MNDLAPIQGKKERKPERRWWHCPYCNYRWATAVQCVTELYCPGCRREWVWFQLSWVDPENVNPSRVRLLMEG